jgi:hypothetical protein
MLSIVDLLDAGTIGRELAAYALAAIGKGASFLVGAQPGGAGKTTVMGALLNFVPPDVELVAADESELARARGAPPRCCFIGHEIGRGDYYAYLWGRPLRDYFAMSRAGHMLATNLHADTVAQAASQICDQNAVPSDDLARVNLMFFVQVSQRGWSIQRRLASVWEGDGRGPHRQIYGAADGLRIGDSRLVSGEQIARAGAVIEQVVAGGARRIQEVRAVIVQRWSELCP